MRGSPLFQRVGKRSVLRAGFLLCLLVALFSLRNTESLDHQSDWNYEEVEQTKSELQQLSARLLEIEEGGLRRLARELHDEVGQTVAMLQIQITNAQAGLHRQPVGFRSNWSDPGRWARKPYRPSGTFRDC